MKPGDDKLGIKIKDWYEKSKDASKEWRDEARINYDFRDGHQWTEKEEAELEENNRLAVVFNRIGPYTDSVIGQQVNNRQEIRYLPRDNSDNSYAQLYSEAARWADDLCDGEDELTDAFSDMITCGMGWTETKMDYTEDAQGLLKTSERIDPLEMYWDENARKRNLSDAQHVQRARRFTEDAAVAKWPKIKDIVPEMSLPDDEKVEPHDSTNNWKYENDQAGGGYPREKTYLILQTQWWSNERYYMVEDPQSQEVVEIEPAKFNKLKESFDQMGIRYAPIVKKQYWQAFSTGEDVLSSGPCPSQKGFTLKPMCAKRDRNKRSWYGLVRAMQDPQKFANKFFSDMMHIIATNRKGGAFVEEGALSDKRQAEEDWNKPDALIMMVDGALAKGKVQDREPGNLPAGMDRLFEIAVTAFPDVNGMSPELMGAVDREQSGVVEEGRKQSSLTILAPMFDALKRHTRERGRIVLDMLENYMSDGRLIRITQPDGQQQMQPLQKPSDMATYDIIVDEVATSPNQKAMVLKVFQVLTPYMQAAGIAPPPSILDYMPLPQTLIEEWKQQLTPKGGEEQSNPLAEAEMVKQQGTMAAKQMDVQVKMAGIDAQRDRTDAELLQKQRELALKEREDMAERMIKWAELRLKEADLEAQHGENLIDLDLKKREIQNPPASNAQGS